MFIVTQLKSNVFPKMPLPCGSFCSKVMFLFDLPCSGSPKCQCHLYGFLPHIYCQQHYHEILAFPGYFVCYVNPDHTGIDLIRFSNSPICG